MDTVNENATFQQNDVFHRVDFAKKAMALIATHSPDHGACVISIDAPWGMGKSTFLRMWINELDSYNQEGDSDHEPFFHPHENMCTYYNAWENDYYDNALIPLLYTICGCISIEKGKTDAWKEGVLSKLQNLISAGAGLLTSVVCAHTTQNPELSALAGGLVNTATDTLLHLFQKKDLKAISEHYEEEVKKRHEFYNALSELAETVGKLYVFIDELDRCKPLFAIQTLECIKHFFNIPNVVFVFATDIGQLSHSVAGVYGQGINAGGYLSKFFDYQLHLPMPSIYDLVRCPFPPITVRNQFLSLLNEVINSIGVTPREMPLILEQANAFWSFYNMTEFGFYTDYVMPYIVLFIGMKYRLPDVYHGFFEGSKKWQECIDKELYKNVYDMLNYTFSNLQTVRESGISHWQDANETAMKTRAPRISMNCNLPYFFAHFCRMTVNEKLTLGEVLQSKFELFSIE